MARREEDSPVFRVEERFSERNVSVPSDGSILRGVQMVPPRASAAVLLICGNGSCPSGLRDNYLARLLCRGGIAPLMVKFLAEQEGGDGQPLFDIALLTDRVLHATVWLEAQPESRGGLVGYYATNAGAAAAVRAAARDNSHVGAIVLQGGRLDLAVNSLPMVKAPTLLVVGQDDEEALETNQMACNLLRCEKEFVVVPGPSHGTAGPAVLEEVARLTLEWYQRHLPHAARRAA